MDSLDPPMEHYWKRCLLANVVSVRNRTAVTPTVDFPLSISDYDVNDEALEAYLATQPETVRYDVGMKVSVFTDSGLTTDSRMHTVGTAEFSAVFGDTYMSRTVPICFCTYTSNEHIPIHGCLVRPVLTGHIMAPTLLPRTKALAQSKVMMACGYLRRGSNVTTVDGATRVILFNDVKCRVLIDDAGYGFGYSKVKSTNVPQSRYNIFSDLDDSALARFLCTDNDCILPVEELLAEGAATHSECDEVPADGETTVAAAIPLVVPQEMIGDEAPAGGPTIVAPTGLPTTPAHAATSKRKQTESGESMLRKMARIGDAESDDVNEDDAQLMEAIDKSLLDEPYNDDDEEDEDLNCGSDDGNCKSNGRSGSNVHGKSVLGVSSDSD